MFLLPSVDADKAYNQSNHYCSIKGKFKDVYMLLIQIVRCETVKELATTETIDFFFFFDISILNTWKK